MKITKHPKKIHIILATLLVLNVAAFFTASAITSHSGNEIHMEAASDDSYMDSGLEVLNWSYTMLQYFRHQGTDNT